VGPGARRLRPRRTRRKRLRTALLRVSVLRIWLRLSGLQVWLSSLQLRLSGLRLRLWARMFRLWPWAKLPLLSLKLGTTQLPEISDPERAACFSVLSPAAAGLLFSIPPISHHHSRALPERNLRLSLGAHKKDAPAEGPGNQRSGWMNRLYSRRCDVKKPELTIGYSAALTGEEKPRSGCGGRAHHSGRLVMHLQIVEAGE
jgi:hypothetical protein